MTIGKTLQPRRKGVILLLVLAVMAMFAMLMATFMVVSSQQYREADSVQKRDRYVHSPEDDLHATVIQMLVGGNSKSSVIRARSFGDTMYGDDNVPGLVGTANWDQTFGDDNELHRFYLDYTNVSSPTNVIDWRSNVGNVFTVRHPDTLKWVSARIVDAGLDGNYYVDVRNFPGVPNPSIFVNTNFYINPPAFAGMGAGAVDLEYDDGSDPDFWKKYWKNYGLPRLTGIDTDNFSFADQLNPNAPTTTGGTAEFGFELDDFTWSLNVDYTAPDAASPFLGFFDMQFDGSGNFLPNDSVNIPSYHRPALVAYYGPTDPNDLRKLVMRPLPFDHPEFDGSNPPLALTNINDLVARLSDSHGYYLDVDTDGDGIKDSVWVDVGLPVRTDLKGRTYKPLVAIKCIDLDGRLNLNAIGNLAETMSTDKVGSGFGPAGINLSRGLDAVYNNLNVTEEVANALFLRRYLGNGENIPRDTGSALTDSVLSQFGGLPTATPLYNYFGNLPDYWDQGVLQFDPLGNRYNSFLQDTVPYSVTTRTDSEWYWHYDTDDNTWKRILWGAPTDYATYPYLFDPNRRTPYDQPFSLPELEAVLRQNDIDKDVLPGRLREILGLSTTGAAELLYNLGHDPDDPANAHLLQQLKDTLKPVTYHTTTLSNDVPVPGPALADQGYASLYELIRSCVVKDIYRVHGRHPEDSVLSEVQKSNLNSQINDITLQLIKFLPDEVKQGGKVNLNKLVEDPAMFLESGMTNYDDALYKRMKMARGIYIILMALSYDKLYGVDDGTGTDTYLVEPYIEPSFMDVKAISDLKTSNLSEFYQVCRELASTRLAQWAINVVEFTDVDAVMTPFVFDANPFDGSIDLNNYPIPQANRSGFGWGDIGTSVDTDDWTLFGDEFNEYGSNNSEKDYRLIWGMERPDLLLTETLAFHNRNVADTSNGGMATELEYVDTQQSGVDGIVTLDTAPSNRGDIDFDQIRMPQGSAFLELYCPADPNRPNYPQEIYNGNLLDIGRLSSNGFPIWQVAIGKSNYKVEGSTTSVETKVLMENSIMHRMKDYSALFSFQPGQPNILEDAIPSELEQDAFDIDRYVWFTTQAPVTATHGIDNKTVYYNHSGAVGLSPNEYLVVGPRLVTHITSMVHGAQGNGYGEPYGPKIDLSYDSDFKATQLIYAPTGSEEYAERINRPKVLIAAAQVDHSTSDLRVSGGQTPVEWTGITVSSETLSLEQVYRRTLWLGNGLSNPVGLGFSISEPFRNNYYTQPAYENSNLLQNADNKTIVDAYGDLTALTDNQDRMEEQPSSGSKPLTTDGLVGTGVAPFYKSAFLQRLADPLREYNATTNPYITVDWNMFDLKVYSGEAADSSGTTKEKDLYLKSPLEESGTKFFASRQWNLTHGNNEYPNPWSRDFNFDDVPDKDDLDLSTSSDIEICGLYEAIDSDNGLAVSTSYALPYQAPLTTPAAAGRLACSQFPVHSLGRFGTNPLLLHPNKVATQGATTPVSGYVPMGNPHADAICAALEITDTTRFKSIYLGAPIYLSRMEIGSLPTSTSYLNADNPRGFLHLPWHNGPLANSYEVMQVPASAPGRFGVEFVDKLNEIKNATNPPPYDTNYLLEDHLWDTVPDPDTAVAGSPAKVEERPGSLGSNVRFAHLLNFQHSHGSWWPTWYAWFDDVANTPTNNASLAFVSLDLANALNFLNVPSRFVGTRDWYYDGDKYYSYSRFQEPGKINLNTMTASGLAALLENREFAGNAFGSGVYEEFDETRGNNIGGNELFPFDMPFRGSSSSASLSVSVPYTSSVNATLMRSDPNNDEELPVFGEKMDDASNSYTALEGIQRLSDMTTTRSNVFAVWLTLGYFEVEKVQPNQFLYNDPITSNPVLTPTGDAFNAIYPDGYTLKKEIGLETGEIKRHRAFYILDRSVPFGYRRGQKLNSEDAILLKRFIE